MLTIRLLHWAARRCRSILSRSPDVDWRARGKAGLRGNGYRLYLHLVESVLRYQSYGRQVRNWIGDYGHEVRPWPGMKTFRHPDPADQDV